MMPRDFAKYHANQHITDLHRPFAKLIELQNDKENTLSYNTDGDPETLIAFIHQGKNMQHSVILYRYFGLQNFDRNSH